MEGCPECGSEAFVQVDEADDGTILVECEDCGSEFELEEY